MWTEQTTAETRVFPRRFVDKWSHRRIYLVAAEVFSILYRDINQQVVLSIWIAEV